MYKKILFIIKKNILPDVEGTWLQVKVHSTK